MAHLYFHINHRHPLSHTISLNSRRNVFLHNVHVVFSIYYTISAPNRKHFNCEPIFKSTLGPISFYTGEPIFPSSETSDILRPTVTVTFNQNSSFTTTLQPSSRWLYELEPCSKPPISLTATPALRASNRVRITPASHSVARNYNTSVRTIDAARPLSIGTSERNPPFPSSPPTLLSSPSPWRAHACLYRRNE